MVKLHPNQQLELAGTDACEILFDLHAGRTGTVRLGRLLKGRDAGRVVMLRPLSARVAGRIQPIVDRVRHISHPKLLKVIGAVRVGSQDYLASEYISGVSFVELRPAVSRAAPLDVCVAVRVVHDALLAAHSGRRLLEGLYGYRVERSIFEETIWVADFGDVFLTELAVFEAICSETEGGGSGVRGMSYLGSGAQACADVHAAGALLFEVLAHRSSQQGAVLGLSTQATKALAGVVTASLSASPSDNLMTAAALAKALAQLPSSLRASIDDVRRYLEKALQTTLDVRREKLRMLERVSAVRSDDDRTQFHRAAGLSGARELDTLRPDPPESGAHRTLAVAPAAPSLPVAKVVLAARKAAEPDAETTLFSRSDAAAVHGNDLPRPVANGPARADDATTVWVREPTAHTVGTNRSLDEDATTVYVASKGRPVEPSVVIQDQEATELFLRAKASSLNGAATERVDERTAISGARAEAAFVRHLIRRRTLARLFMLTCLALVSALLAWAAVRFDVVPR